MTTTVKDSCSPDQPPLGPAALVPEGLITVYTGVCTPLFQAVMTSPGEHAHVHWEVWHVSLDASCEILADASL